jgi:REP element-mobilizing transposase RayT
MSVRRQIPENEGVYFITFTCARWLHLFESANAYDVVYKWFDYLKSKGHYILGYVIMPNHVHALIGFVNTGVSINTTIGNGKRFMAYEIVERLKQKTDEETLHHLREFVNATDKKRNKQHEVFEPSFDWKECTSDKLIEQKLDYMHDNPCRGIWELAKQPMGYAHSSAKYYATGERGVYEVTSYTILQDVDLGRRRGVAAESRGGDSAGK